MGFKEGQWFDINEGDPDPNRRMQTLGMVRNGNLTIRHTEEVTASLAYNRHRYNLNEKPTGKEWHRFARIPAGVYHEIKDKHGIDALNPAHHEAFVNLMHQPEYRHLRTAPGNFRKKPERKFYRASTPSAGTPMSLIGRKKK